MKKLSGKGKFCAFLAILLFIISIGVIIVDSNMYVWTIVGCVLSIILAVIAFTAKSKTNVAEVTYQYNHPKSTPQTTWAVCEYEGKEFRLIVGSDVYKPYKLVPGAKYRVEYEVPKNVSDPKEGGVGTAVKMTRID